MIDPATLSDDDIGKRVIWEIAPGVEEMGQLAAWASGVVVIVVPQAGSKYMRPVEIDPAQVRWANEGVKTNGDIEETHSGGVDISSSGEERQRRTESDHSRRDP